MVLTRISYAPQLPLELSFSPLLTGAPSSPLQVQKKKFPLRSCLRPTISSAAGTVHLSRTSSQRSTASKPLPSLPSHFGPSHSPIVNLLDLLDRMDNDISCEVQRVLENIRETRALVKEVKGEQRARSSEFLAQRDREKESQDTKGVHDEFWLGV
ncbi:hypothetical protein FOMPIDRAFT_1050212 [Fomitopsis schrenkii]|uniref:Uncharacterized protein n=1 Tax=Fomitopsis schrenkii TaxID=2126942 RepID=S8E427_FOMSC|nr:hypothetical protein FOMPIDRAFT_1050212 [Fomitopsis schrenkii]